MNQHYNIMRELRVPPAYKTFDDASEQWTELRRQAVACLLENGTNELRRHALVSRENKHYCHECFTCACVWLIDDLKGNI